MTIAYIAPVLSIAAGILLFVKNPAEPQFTDERLARYPAIMRWLLRQRWASGRSGGITLIGCGLAVLLINAGL